MKKIKYLLPLFIIFFSSLTQAAVFEIESKILTTGSQESFGITINDSPNIVDSLGFDIQFCSDLLSYEGYDEGELVKNNYSFFRVKYIQAESIIRVGMVASNNKQIDMGTTGLFLNLHFTALQTGGCELTPINMVDDIANWTVKNGWFHSSSPPAGKDDSITIIEDTSYSGALTALNPNNLTLTYKLLSFPSKGTLTLTDISSGAFTYTSFTNENGIDSFKFAVNDGTIDSIPAKITITITSINDIPTISSISDQTVYESTSDPITCTVFDPDDPLSKVIVTVTSSNNKIIPNSAQNIIIQGTGSVRTIYLTPAEKSFGQSMMTVKATDPNQVSTESRFTVVSAHKTYTLLSRTCASISQTVAHGTIDPSGINSVNKDEDLTFKIIPDDGYEIETLWIDSERLWNVTPLYTFWKVSQNHTLTATFIETQDYTISTAVVPSSAGQITPSQAVLSKGQNQLVKIKTSPGYLLDDVIIDGISYGDLSYYVFSDISQSHHITASYTKALTPVAQFSASYTSGSVPFQVKFYDHSQNTINNWLWGFGDGSTSQNPNPVHTFISPGSYTVSLLVTGPGGTDSFVKTDYIYIDQACRPTMNFSVNNHNVNKGETISLLPTDIQGYSSLAWHFGDAYTSSAENPTHTYSEAGYYTVTLTASFGPCSETKTKRNFITVNGRKISGQVQPVISNCIIDVWHNKNLISSTTTDANGQYIVDNLPLKDGFIVGIRPPQGNNAYESQYYDSSEYGVNSPRNASKLSTISNDLTIDFTLKEIPNIGICGSVVDENNMPVSFVHMTVYSTTGSLVNGQTDSDGNYQIQGLIQADNYIVFAWSNDHQREFFYAIPDNKISGIYQPTYSVFSKDTATQLTPTDPCIQNIDIVLKSESIRGRVLTESNVPVGFAKVNAWSDGFKTGNFTIADEFGYYTITGLTPISKTDDYANMGYVVEVLKTIYPYQAYNIASSRNDAIRVHTKIEGIDFRLKDASSISGSIKDKYQSAIPYATVCVAPKNGGIETCSQSALSGSYSISGLNFSDDYVVYAYSTTFPPQYYKNAQDFDHATPIQLSAAGITGIDFIFDEGAIIQGQIVTNDGSELNTNIFVNLRSKTANVDQYIQTDANGRYKFIQLDYNISDYVISVFSDGYLPSIYNASATVSKWSDAETVAPSDTIVRTITLSKGAVLKGTITYLGELEGDVVVEVYSNQILQGAALSTNYLLNECNYKITGLSSNQQYTIQILHDSLVADPQSITLANEAIVDFTLVEPDLTISGQLLGIPQGKKIQITAWSLSNQTKTKSLIGTGDIINYTFYGLKPDPNFYVDVFCESFPYQIYNGKFRLSDADIIDLSTASSDNIDFTFVKQSGQLSGNIIYPNGGQSGESVFVSAFYSLDSERFDVPTTLDENCSKSNGCSVSYLIDGIDPSKKYYLFVSSDQYKSCYYNGTSGTIHLNEAIQVNANQSVDLTLTRGLSISGVVSDTDGQAVSGLDIEAWSQSLSSLGKAKTNKSGMFSIYGLEQTDDYIVYAIEPGIAPYFYNSLSTVRNKDAAQRINPEIIKNIAITYDPGKSITGMVSDTDGIRLAGIWVKAESKSKNIQAGVFTLNDGTFEILNLPDSNDYIISAQPLHTYISTSKTNVSAGSDNINFFLSAGYTLSGIIIDANNNGIANAEISLWSKTLTYSSFDRSDSSGNYQISGIPEGNDFLLYVESLGESSYVPLKEDGFSVYDNISKNIVLEQGYSIKGSVYTDASESIPYSYVARITAYSEDLSFFEDTESDMNGFYEISNMGDASDYVLEVFPSVNYANQVKNNQVAGSTVNFVLETGGTIGGSIIDSTGNVVSGARVEISSETANIFETTATDRNGDYEINGLKRTRLGNQISDYLVYVYADGFPPHSNIGKSVEDTVNFILSSSDANVITGVIMDSSSTLPPEDVGILVRTFYQDRYEIAVKPVKADENGVYTVTALDSSLSYRFLFKAYQNGTLLFEQWADENENGVTDIGQARAYGTDESVRFKFNDVWK
ncbi:MAG: carboxypeptidase regulatory-like domain-containing protein [Candidatus Magnetomorum sp.]|nr:carboxypeptidase regulatory-like domain-containing protein [Candidatus Magnetomorum sp.]